MVAIPAWVIEPLRTHRFPIMPDDAIGYQLDIVTSLPLGLESRRRNMDVQYWCLGTRWLILGRRAMVARINNRGARESMKPCDVLMANSRLTNDVSAA